MPITLADDLGDVDLSRGSLPPDEVVLQYLCNTGEDRVEHDPDKPPDSRCRASHAALHGVIFQLGQAPIPPISWNCRCAIRYLAVHKTAAADVLDAAPSDTAPAASVVPAYREHLNAEAPDWHKVAKAAATAPPQRRMVAAYDVASDLGMSRDEAQMAVAASPYPMSEGGPLGVSYLAGLGRAAKRLVAAWKTGDMDAARKLAESYPSTYRRMILEDPSLPKV